MALALAAVSLAAAAEALALAFDSLIAASFLLASAFLSLTAAALWLLVASVAEFAAASLDLIVSYRIFASSSTASLLMSIAEVSRPSRTIPWPRVEFHSGVTSPEEVVAKAQRMKSTVPLYATTLRLINQSISMLFSLATTDGIR